MTGWDAAHRRRSRTRSSSARICCICLDPISETDPVSERFECGHEAQTHHLCIEAWLQKQETCPLCRRDLKDPILDNMRKFPDDLEAQLRGCRAVLSKGFASHDYQRHCVEAGAIELVMAAIHRFKGEMAIAEVAPGAIWVLAMASGEAQEQLANLGACEAINELMVLYPLDAPVVSQACMACYGLAFANKPLQVRLAQAGSIFHILKALEQHMDDLDVVRSGVEALMALCCDLRDNQDAAGRGYDQLAGGKGACEILMDVMHRYADTQEVVYLTLDTVMKMAIDHVENKERFGKNGMCAALLDALHRFGDDETFGLIGLTATYAIAEHSRDNQERLTQGTGASQLVEVITKHKGLQDAVIVGMDVLFALTLDSAHPDPDLGSIPTTSSAPQALMEAGACELVLKILQKYSTSPDIYPSALKAAACFFLVLAGSQDRFGGSEGCKIVCEVMANCLMQHDRMSMEVCCRLVAALALGNQANAQHLRENAACELVCSALREGLSRWEALQAIADLAEFPECRDALGQNDAVNLVFRQLVAIQEDNGGKAGILEDVTTVDLACLALASLIMNHEDNQKRIAELSWTGKVTRLDGTETEEQVWDVTSLVCWMLREDSQEEAACSMPMHLLGTLCMAEEEYQDKAGDQGAVDAILTRVKAAIQAEDQDYVIRQGIQTLSDLVCGHGPNQDRVCSFDEGQGLEMLLQLADRSCLEAIDCCRWLSLVAMVADSNSTNQEALVDLKTVQKAMEFVKQFPSDDVLESVLLVVGTLASGITRLQDIVGELGACELLCEAVRTHPKDPNILHRSSAVMLGLSQLENCDDQGRTLHMWKDTRYNCRQRLRDIGAADLFLDVIKQNKESDDGLMLGGLVLSLALLGDDAPAITNGLKTQGVQELAVELMNKHAIHDTFMTAAGGLVGELCLTEMTNDWSDLMGFYRYDTTAQNYFLGQGLHHLIIQSMRRYPDDKGCTIMGFISLGNLCYRNTNATRQVLEVGVLDVLETRMSRLKDEPDMLFYGLVLVANMSTAQDKDLVDQVRPWATALLYEAQDRYPDDPSLCKYAHMVQKHLEILTPPPLPSTTNAKSLSSDSTPPLGMVPAS